MGYVSGYILCVPCLFATCVDFVSQWSPAEPLLTVSCMLSPFHTLMMFAEFPMMRLLVTTLLVSFFLLPTCHAADELTLQPLTEQVEQYGRIEFVIGVDRQYAHPFDPEEVKLDLVIRAPAGGDTRVPAFYMQAYDRQEVMRSGRPTIWYYPSGMPGWRARFAPSEVGSFSAVAELTDQRGVRQSASVQFTVRPSASPGFVRVSRNDPRYFEFSNGKPFFPIGQNLAFIGETQFVTPAKVPHIFDELSQNGANYLRIWTGCHDWALAIEARKSVWGRSWSWRPPFDAQPDSGQPDRKCVHLESDKRSSVELEPSHNVALRPGTQYVLSGHVRLDPEARLEVSVGGRELPQPLVASSDQDWQPLQLRFTSGDQEYWLGRVTLRVTGKGSAWIDRLSLKEEGGGPELLWEAAVNRPVRGYYNPLDCAMLDDVVSAAEQRGIYLQVCLLTRDAYMGDLKDESSPKYERAIVDAENLLRYAVARWGYATSIATWEYFNENDPGLPMDRFYREVGQYLQRVDIYGHLRSTSTWHPSAHDCRNPNLDVASVHFYLRPIKNPPYADEVAAAVGNADWLRRMLPTNQR